MISLLKKTNRYLKKKFNMGFVLNYPYRTSVNFAKNHFKDKELICAEVGTFEGENSEYILNKLNVKKIFLIDPWLEYKGYPEKNKTQKNLNKAFNITKKRLKKYGEKAVFIKKLSHESLDLIPDNLDFVYIDGNHEYKYVKEDMINYYKKLRKGGILAGHDIDSLGVSKAFCEFVSEKKSNPFISKMDWWVIKK